MENREGITMYACLLLVVAVKGTDEEVAEAAKMCCEPEVVLQLAAKFGEDAVEMKCRLIGAEQETCS